MKTINTLENREYEFKPAKNPPAADGKRIIITAKISGDDRCQPFISISDGLTPGVGPCFSSLQEWLTIRDAVDEMIIRVFPAKQVQSNVRNPFAKGRMNIEEE